MHYLKRSVLAVSVSLIGLLGVAAPALAGQYDSYNAYYPQNNCGWYASYGNGYWNNNCQTQGSLTVYVQVNNQNSQYSRSSSDFTVSVTGANASQRYFQGSQNGTTVQLNGSYSVAIQNLMGFSPSYSSACSGVIAQGETRTCVITLTGSYAYYPPYYPQQPVYQPYVSQPVTIVASYVPSLPNTGFEPVSQTALAFSLAVVFAVGVLLLPYVRKAFAVALR